MRNQTNVVEYFENLKKKFAVALYLQTGSGVGEQEVGFVGHHRGRAAGGDENLDGEDGEQAEAAAEAGERISCSGVHSHFEENQKENWSTQPSNCTEGFRKPG